MTDPYVGEIRCVAFNAIPDGWMSCDGSTLQISQFTALYSLLGTAYGGDGKRTFGLPNLNNRAVTGTSAGALGLTTSYPIATSCDVVSGNTIQVILDNP